MNYQAKYLKYKAKYIALKSNNTNYQQEQIGGAKSVIDSIKESYDEFVEKLKEVISGRKEGKWQFPNIKHQESATGIMIEILDKIAKTSSTKAMYMEIDNQQIVYNKKSSMNEFVMYFTTTNVIHNVSLSQNQPFELEYIVPAKGWYYCTLEKVTEQGEIMKLKVDDKIKISESMSVNLDYVFIKDYKTPTQNVVIIDADDFDKLVKAL